MCGIVGLFSKDIQESELDSMLSMIDHRGPDELGTYLGSHIGLGNARLAIIDIASGQQPMVDPSTGVALAFNGEIFNYIELRALLIQRGISFKTNSDTEVILQLYLQDPDSFLEQLNGQFAISIWDPRTEKLLLARDRFGICPLFYNIQNEESQDPFLIFGSEIKSLLTHPRVKRELNPKALDQIFTFWSSVAGHTSLKNIHELMPGHKMVFQKGKLPQISTYWTWPFPQLQEKSTSNFESAQEEFREVLKKSVSIRLRADIEVGSYLSGGIDSSAIAALASEVQGENLSTFSIGFNDASYDETPYQKMVSDTLKTKHHHVTCDSTDIDRLFEKTVWHTETPLFRTAPSPMNHLSRNVRDRNIKVVLTGEGADEILLGYDIFREVKIRRFWQRSPQSTARPQLLKKLYAYLPQFSNPRFANLAIQSFKGTLESDSPFYSHLIRWNNNSANKVYFSEGLQDQLKDYSAVDDFHQSLPKEFYESNDVDRAQYLELMTLLRGYLLSSQGDRMLMSNSIEGRFPFLDHEFVKFANRLPERYKLLGLKDKHIMRKAMESKLPSEICNRPKFAYQAPEVRAFFRTDGSQSELVNQYLGHDKVKSRGLFDPELVQQLIQKIESSSLERLGTRDNMAFVQILTTHIFYEKFIQQDIPALGRSLSAKLNVKTRTYSGERKHV